MMFPCLPWLLPKSGETCQVCWWLRAKQSIFCPRHVWVDIPSEPSEERNNRLTAWYEMVAHDHRKDAATRMGVG